MAPDASLREVSATAPFRSTFTEGFGAILVDGASPTWLLATLDGQIQRRAQIKVPPFSGRTEVEIALDWERTALHVQVLDHTLSQPVPHVRVIVEQVGQLAATDHREGQTDAAGYAVFAGCTGELSVRTEHAPPVDASPWRRVVLMGPRCAAAES
jgi:hypothetical protein